MALDTVDLLNHLGWKSNVHVIGVSMGGMIALELASNHPEYIGSLTLTSTHAGDLIPTFAGVTTIPRMMFTSDPYRRIELSCSLLFPQVSMPLMHTVNLLVILSMSNRGTIGMVGQAQ
jgi:pimeloyl-ACP methyl ester carboxylesterase